MNTNTTEPTASTSQNRARTEAEDDEVWAKINAAIELAAYKAAPLFTLFGWGAGSKEITEILREGFKSLTNRPESSGISLGRFYISCASQGEQSDSDVEYQIHLNLSDVCDVPHDFKYE